MAVIEYIVSSGNIIKLDATVDDDDEDWDLERIILARKVEASGLRGELCAQQEKCCSTSVEVLTNMLSVVAMAEHWLGLNCRVTKRKQALVEGEQKLQVASSPALSDQQIALEKAEDAGKYLEDLENAEV